MAAALIALVVAVTDATLGGKGWRPRGVHMSSSPTNQNSDTVRAGGARVARSCRHHVIILRQAVAAALVALVVAATNATTSGWGRQRR